VNGITTRLNEQQVTAIKLKIQSHHNLQSSLEVKNAKTRLEKALLVRQALRLQEELIAELSSENARLEAACGREVFDHRATKAALSGRETGLAMIQRIAEAGGLLVSDREDIRAAYGRGT
jgi:hypothetical protein